MKRKIDIPDVVKQLEQGEPFERVPVKGWVNCGSYWKRSRIFDVLCFPDGTAVVEVKIGKQHVLLPFGTYDLSKSI